MNLALGRRVGRIATEALLGFLANERDFGSCSTLDLTSQRPPLSPTCCIDIRALVATSVCGGAAGPGGRGASRPTGWGWGLEVGIRLVLRRRGKPISLTASQISRVAAKEPAKVVQMVGA